MTLILGIVYTPTLLWAAVVVLLALIEEGDNSSTCMTSWVGSTVVAGIDE